ncbi:SSI family serine proteinase inhibitor [Kineococcus auxinigenes]|uniref:SSI family serine proteinase inhibitor n=1 Tax=unclassified Kineococcus TaxID=2621656 RepID=UPI003D7E004F
MNSTSSTSSGAAAPAPTGPSSLTVTVDDGAGGTSTWTLTCSSDGTTGGTHPDPAAACAALAAAEAPFAPVPPDTACTQVYGGPQRATVTGTWDGQEVSAQFDRTDGCEVARWNALASLLSPGAQPAGPTSLDAPS